MTDTRRWWALGAISLATFMTYLDNNVVNVALPTIQRDLGLSISGLEWIVSGYILVFAGLMLVGGRLADVFGRRRIFLIGLVVFTAASFAAGMATDGGVLIATRAVQGVGAASRSPPRRWRCSPRSSPTPGNARRRSACGARSARSPSPSGR